MKKILHINAHQPYPFSEGKLNHSLTRHAISALEEKGYEVRTSRSAENYVIEDELDKHRWADYIILQSPVNWMGVPWKFKRYMDEVFTAGMGGELCNGDGRTAEAPKLNYGAGGTLTGKQYMLSLTFNAPRE
jgi:NADPH dehydrogenase (quinone)